MVIIDQNSLNLNFKADLEMEKFDYLFGEDDVEEYSDVAILMQDVLAKVFDSKKRIYIDRNRIDGDRGLNNDYFDEEPVYSEEMFRRRFRMKCNLFYKVCDAVAENDDYFIQKRDAAGKLGY